MAKSKQDRINNITQMNEDITWALELVDAKLAIPEDIIEVHNEYIIAGEKWLATIEIKEYRELRKTWKLRTPEVWANYDALGGFEDHAEVKLLRTAKHNFRRAITSQKRPDLFKKTKVQQWRKKRESKRKATVK